MKKIIAILVISTSIFAVCVSSTCAQSNSEKLLTIKGVYIGIDISEAKTIMEKLLGNDWIVDPISDAKQIRSDILCGAITGEEDVFGKKQSANTSGDYNIIKSFDAGSWITGDRGFAIRSKYTYEGYISTDKGSNKVTRISLSGKLVDYIFSAADIWTDDFVVQFRSNYNMPQFPWIPHGWQYSSPNGYIITIRNPSKALDIKKGQIITEKIVYPERPKANFD